jgi:putative hydrolase of HD superfamily
VDPLPLWQPAWAEGEKMKSLANFFFEVGMLKRTPRSGFQFLGSGAESVAEHSYRAALLGFTLARLDDQADVGRVLQLCLFHDIPEARTGDLNYVNKSREAQLAHDADQLEMILALKEYKDLGNRYADEWYPFSVRRLKTDTAKRLAESIWSTDSSRWWFDDDEDWWVKGRR